MVEKYVNNVNCFYSQIGLSASSSNGGLTHIRVFHMKVVLLFDLDVNNLSSLMCRLCRYMGFVQVRSPKN